MLTLLNLLSAVTLLIWVTSWEPHSGQTAWPQSGQYSIPVTTSWVQ